MKFLKISVLLLVHVSICLAQKRAIDTNAVNQWERVNDGHLSLNGKYFYYTISSKTNYLNDTLIFKDAKTSKPIVKIKGGSSCSFTANENIAVFLIAHDTLVFFSLSTGKFEYIPSVGSYQMSPNKRWLIYQKMGLYGPELNLRNVVSMLNAKYANVLEWRFTGNDKVLLHRRNREDSQDLSILELTHNSLKTVWKGENCSGLNLNNDGKVVAFIVNEKGKDKNGKSIWTLNIDSAKAKKAWDCQENQLSNGLYISSIRNFSLDGTRIFVDLGLEKGTGPLKRNMPNVDIWSYTDPMLQSEQMVKFNPVKNTILATLDIKTRAFKLLQEPGESIDSSGPYNDRWMIKYSAIGSMASSTESYWNTSGKVSKVFFDTKENVTKYEVPANDGGGCVSPDGRFYVFVDKNYQNCFSYNLLTGNIVNLTNSIGVPKIDTSFDGSRTVHGELDNRISFLKNGTFIIVDKYDIWQLDPSNLHIPKNLTNGFGRKNLITFRIAGSYDKIDSSSTVLLNAFDNKKKDEGLFKITMNKLSDPQQLVIGPYHYELCIEPDDNLFKDKRHTTHVVKIENTTSSPNFYITKDFKVFKKMTDISTERSYNWMTSELVNFRALNGYTLPAVIYKPENFNKKNKYPIIITYYEKKADQKNVFKIPELMSDNLNIPWFVSRGYIVVTPDIHYQIGEPGNSALSAVVGIANFLIKMPFVDSTKIAVMGHSWGACETNYIVSHTNIFAAAVASCGLSDLVSDYGATMPKSGVGLQYFADKDQLRIGATLWENTKLFIENSPVFAASDVNTPLLMMNNKGDEAIPFAQGVEFFTALRRLGKKVWMLQYDREGHVISNEKSKYDYTTRIQQFFDHYLKDAPAPVWMTRGIPAYLKGTTDGFEYDKEIKTPPPSPLIDPKRNPVKIYWDN